jgi:hypothetical protein
MLCSVSPLRTVYGRTVMALVTRRCVRHGLGLPAACARCGTPGWRGRLCTEHLVAHSVQNARLPSLLLGNHATPP